MRQKWGMVRHFYGWLGWVVRFVWSFDEVDRCSKKFLLFHFIIVEQVVSAHGSLKMQHSIWMCKGSFLRLTLEGRRYYAYAISTEADVKPLKIYVDAVDN